jgi:hypothetical protein
MSTAPAETTRLCAAARSPTRTSKWTLDASATVGALVAWKESRWPCGGGSRVTHHSYHGTGVPPSKPAQNRASSHGSAQSSTISLIPPLAASPPIRS